MNIYEELSKTMDLTLQKDSPDDPSEKKENILYELYPDLSVYSEILQSLEDSMEIHISGKIPFSFVIPR